MPSHWPGRHGPTGVSAARSARVSAPPCTAEAAAVIASRTGPNRPAGSSTASAARPSRRVRVGTTSTSRPSRRASAAAARATMSVSPSLGRMTTDAPVLARTAASSSPVGARRRGPLGTSTAPPSDISRVTPSPRAHETTPMPCGRGETGCGCSRPSVPSPGLSDVCRTSLTTPASPPASMAAAVSSSSTCAWTWNSAGPPATATESPRCVRWARSRSARSGSLPLRRYITSTASSDVVPRPEVGPGVAAHQCGTSPSAPAGRSSRTACSASTTRTSPAPPASTTPASRSSGSCSGVRARARCAASSAASTTTRTSCAPSSTAPRAPTAAARATVRMVPSTGAASASHALREADSKASATSRGPATSTSGATASASPRVSWARMTPELPRAARSMPRAMRASPSRSRSVPPPLSKRTRTCSSAPSRVRYMLVPVSPSATGKTLSASTCSRAAASDSRAVTAQRRAVTRSSAGPGTAPT